MSNNEVIEILKVNKFSPVNSDYKDIARQVNCCMKRKIRLIRYNSKGENYYWFCLGCFSIILDKVVY